MGRVPMTNIKGNSMLGAVMAAANCAPRAKTTHKHTHAMEQSTWTCAECVWERGEGGGLSHSTSIKAAVRVCACVYL